MANSTNQTVNPLSTVAAYAPDFRGDVVNLWKTATLAAASAVTLPQIESFPAVFAVASQGNAVATCRGGLIIAHSASIVSVSGATNMNQGLPSGTDDIGVTISGGVITLTSQGTFTNPGTVQPVYVKRIA
jgi:hypothetical protein